MGKTLVLAEKPSVGRELARVLGCGQNGPGCIIGPRYIVTWALGHLVTLADPEHYHEKYKTWRAEDLPMLPPKMELVTIKETAKQFHNVKALMQRPDVDELVLATDAGREGELVGRWIMEKANWRKPMKRLWISSQTDKAVREGFSKLRPGREYDDLYYSAQCRAEADWLVGLNVTRALTCKYNAQLSAGRVQTPTLKMIVEREKEIQEFIPVDFWRVEAQTGQFTLQWRDKKSGQTRIFAKTEAEKIASKLRGGKAVIIEVKKEQKQELPPLAYDLTELQRDANRKYGFSAKQTSTVMQKLYETHKLLTYPRTDSRYLTTDIVPTLPERLRSITVGPYAEAARNLLKKKITPTSRLVDNNKVSDHHAIIPTEQPVNLNALSVDERKVYDLVVKRFLAVLSEPFCYQRTTLKAEAAGEILAASGKIIQSKGWKKVYENEPAAPEALAHDDEQDQSLPELVKGQQVPLLSVKLAAGKTKPPARYTEATLLSAMEHPGKFIENEAMREILESTSGLGTPATRADIIEKLFASFYIERKGQEILPTSKGIQLINLVPDPLKSPELTAKWEERLALISKGKADAAIFVKEMRNYAAGLVATVVASSSIFTHDNITRTKCPECGKNLLEVNGKKGKMLVCPDRGCGYRKGLALISNARCPACHKKMELRGEGENKLFVCSCGFREKLESFNKRRENEKTNINKREVGQFLQKQKEEPINSALAEALAKWKKGSSQE